jgi:hypothetical protein
MGCFFGWKHLLIMDFLRGQYVLYGPVRIILTEDKVRRQYNPNRSIYNILTELKVLNFYITCFSILI